MRKDDGHVSIRLCGGGGYKARLLTLAALSALIALCAAAALSLAPAAADGHFLPDNAELVISLKDSSDNVVASGSEFTVEAALRFSSHHPEWRLRIGSASMRLYGPLEWESSGSTRLTASTQNVMGYRYYAPTNAAGDTGGNGAMGMVRALDGRTAVARDNRDNGALYIYDAWNKEQALIITPPAGAGHFGTSARRSINLPRSGQTYDSDYHFMGTAIAVWHETEALAWMFVGAPTSSSHVGRLYVYSIDWATDPPTATLHGSMEPPATEYRNRGALSNYANYGSAVTISADGSTLAVGAPKMNMIGAVYVYTRPDGAGQNWGDIAYDDGVKLTVTAVPPWGDTATDTATNGAVDYTSASACDDYCKRARAAWWSELGLRTVALSGDGRVLAVGAPTTEFPDTLAGGAFTNANLHDQSGAAYVFVAPSGGWQAAEDAVAGKTVVPARTAAPADFSPETHVSPGPRKRITSPTASLRQSAWADAAGWQRFGQQAQISRDGTTVAISTSGPDGSGETSAGGPQRAYIFQVDDADDWQELDAACCTLPDATFSNVGTYGAPGWGWLALSGDGSTMLTADPSHHNYGGVNWADQGRITVFKRPADGQWADDSGSTQDDNTWYIEDTDRTRWGANWAYPVYSLDGQRLVINELGTSPYRVSIFIRNASGGRAWFSDQECTVSVVEGVATTTCPITLADANVLVPAGTPDGSMTIGGQITLQAIQYYDENRNNPRVLDEMMVTAKPLEVRIGRVRQLAEVNFDLATDTRGTSFSADDRPFPAVLAAGQSTTLRLQLLNENGKPSAAGAASSVRVYTNVGVLDSSVGCVRSGAATATCAINLDNLTGSNSGAIPITLTHSGTAGAALVRASVISTNGEVFDPQAISVALTGPPASLSIAAPGGGLLNIGTPDSGADKDDRDTLTLAVSAQDQAGQTVALPSGGSQRVTLTDPDGERVASGVELEWPLGGADRPTLNAAGQRQVRVNVNRAAAQPLANGEYTLEVRAGALTATQTFSVSGGPAAITLSEPDGSLEQGGRFSLTAAIVDADGAPVPDGTTVEWLSQGLGTTPGPVRLAAETKTTNGAASAEFLSILSGTVYVTAEAGGVKQLALLRISEPAGAVSGPRGPAADLSSTTPNSYAVWQGAAPVAASELYRALPPTVVTLSQAVVAGWKHYDGAAARDFTIPPGAVLWLSGR